MNRILLFCYFDYQNNIFCHFVISSNNEFYYKIMDLTDDINPSVTDNTIDQALRYIEEIVFQNYLAQFQTKGLFVTVSQKEAARNYSVVGNAWQFQ